MTDIFTPMDGWPPALPTAAIGVRYVAGAVEVGITTRDQGTVSIQMTAQEAMEFGAQLTGAIVDAWPATGGDVGPAEAKIRDILGPLVTPAVEKALAASAV